MESALNLDVVFYSSPGSLCAAYHPKGPLARWHSVIHNCTGGLGGAAILSARVVNEAQGVKSGKIAFLPALVAQAGRITRYNITRDIFSVYLLIARLHNSSSWFLKSFECQYIRIASLMSVA